MKNLGDSGTSTMSLNCLNLSGSVMLACGRGLNRSGIGIIPIGTIGVFVGFQGYQLTPRFTP